ncbi:MAG: glycine C-acetyltransferase [Defluviitaleaceae bacterium]|nr:glycine C-acetyltransferase [Defluviitaleaceae bacterium]MCL2240109.1 glycine C-acetyltransferase [Defluviitaleaceae bacterium]
MKTAYKHWAQAAADIRASGLWKTERVITTPQSSCISTDKHRDLINMCANNYLGLADHPEVKAAAQAGIDRWGYGLSSVRFICGTQALHKELEAKLSEFLRTEDTILYSSCYDANGGLFETILTAQDAIISDELNHASIIDGVRLCKAARYRYKNNDMAELEARLQEAQNARVKAIVCDGVFSMDGTIANLPAICDLAERYDAIVIVDDSHGVGVIGAGLRGTPEYHGVIDRVDVMTGTLGKALGGSSGGYTTGRKAIIDILRQKSRTYLFSNTLSPIIASGTLKVLELITRSTELKTRLEENTAYFRQGIKGIGLEIKEGTHPIVPVMLYDELKAAHMAEKLLEKGVYAIGFFYPVVPKGLARVRCQVSAAHTREQLDTVIAAFATLVYPASPRV